VQGLVKVLDEQGYAPTTIEAVLRRVSTLLGAATREGLVTRNVAEGVKAPAATHTAEERAKALDKEQVDSLLKSLPGDYAVLGRLMLTTGLRPSEAAGLTADRVDFLRKTITIDRQLIGTGPTGSGEFGPPKTPSSSRTIPLPVALVEPLSIQAGMYKDGGLLFRTRVGGPLIRQRLSETWRRTAKKLTSDEGTPIALPGSVRGFHALRHTFVSVHLAEGTPVPTVSRLIGHKTVAETLQTYAHMMPGDDTRAANVVADALGMSG